MPCRQEVEEILVEIFVLMVFDFLAQYWQLFSLQGHIVNIIGLACSFTIAHLCPGNQKAARQRANEWVWLCSSKTIYKTARFSLQAVVGQP